MTDNEFYQKCAEILSASHSGEAFPYHTRNRWNNRSAGRGRFEGRGIIRLFGDTVHVALTEPAITRVFENREAALEFLAALIDNARESAPSPEE